MSAISSNSNECNLQNLDDEGMSDGHSGQTNGEHSVAQCSTASAPKDIKFNIHHKYTTHNIVVSDRSTIGWYCFYSIESIQPSSFQPKSHSIPGDLKARIFDVTTIPVCRQNWCGWVQSSENYDDSTALHTMNLSDENELIVNDIKDLRDNDIGIVDDVDVERLTRTFTLNILLGNTNNTAPLQLNFPGTKSIADVKKDVYSVTNIAVRHQQWHGWPSGLSDDVALALTGIPYEHNLVLNNLGLNTTEATSTSTSTSTNQPKTNASQAAAESSNARLNHNNEPIEVDSDSSIDEFEDASDFNGDDDIFAAPAAHRRRNDLSKYHRQCQTICESID